MARYIDVDKFTKDLRSQYCLNCVSYDGLKCKTCEIDDTIAFVESAPTADVVEVKRGKWILDESVRQRFGKVRNPEDYEHYCSCCNEEALCNYGDDSGSWWYLSDYCPNCGAKMDGGTK